jgi:rare lipoprotein A
MMHVTLSYVVAACMAASLLVPEAALSAPRSAIEGQTFRQTGLASWYGRAFQRRKTANGARFDMNALTAAHRTLPLNAVVRVTNLANGRSIDVRITDRGPYVPGRIIDLSARAAELLNMKDQGVARVRIEMLESDDAT